jgi:hypothetical protein
MIRMRTTRDGTVGFIAALLLLALSMVSAGVVSVDPVSAAAKPSSTSVAAAKVGRACKTPGQVAGTAPNQLVCQTGTNNKLLWARSRLTSNTILSTPITSPDSFLTNFRSSPSAKSAAAAVALLNTQGAEGYAYIGPVFVGGATHETFLKAEPTTTYRYETVDMPPSVDGVMALLRAKGKAGLIYKGPVLFADALEKTSLLFVASDAKKTTYSYRNSTWPSDESVMLGDLNTNGADGYRYLGDLVPDPAQLTVGLRVFVKDDQSSETFSYSLKPQITDQAKFLAEATAMGLAKAAWKGGYVVGSGVPPMQIRSLYEKSSLTTKPITYSFSTPVPVTIESLVTKANENAAKGNLLWGQYILATETVSVYSNSRMTTLPLVGVVIP